MIKQIGKYNILISPFMAVKAWELDNVSNQDVVLLEELSSSVGIPDTAVALDYVDYTTSPLSINSDCNIALEQQDADGANYEEGINRSGLFNIESEDQNSDGTYKRLVYDQTYRAFYNQHRNPTQIFGLDNIDFQLSKINRVIGNEFLMFNIPRNIMGDRLVAGTIKMYDAAMDDNIEIYDDSYGNLIIGNNLFSKIQEVRSLSNLYFSGTSSFQCPAYNIPYIIGAPSIMAFQTTSSLLSTASLEINWAYTTYSSSFTINFISKTSPPSGTSYNQNIYLSTISGSLNITDITFDGNYNSSSTTPLVLPYNLSAIPVQFILNGSSSVSGYSTGSVTFTTNNGHTFVIYLSTLY